MKTQTDPAMIIRTADPGELLRVNGSFTEAFGLTSDDLKAHSLSTWIHAEDWPALVEL